MYRYRERYIIIGGIKNSFDFQHPNRGSTDFSLSCLLLEIHFESIIICLAFVQRDIAPDAFTFPRFFAVGCCGSYTPPNRYPSTVLVIIGMLSPFAVTVITRNIAFFAWRGSLYTFVSTVAVGE